MENIVIKIPYRIENVLSLSNLFTLDSKLFLFVSFKKQSFQARLKMAELQLTHLVQFATIDWCLCAAHSHLIYNWAGGYQVAIILLYGNSSHKKVISHDTFFLKGPFTNCVIQNLEMFDPSLPLCQLKSSFQWPPPPPKVDVIFSVLCHTC